MSQIPNSNMDCRICGATALQGTTMCGRCLAEAILADRNDSNTLHEPHKNTSKPNHKAFTSILIALFVLVTFSGIVLLNSAWWAYRKAQEQDTVLAYERFIQKHGKSEYAVKAWERAAGLDYAMVMENPSSPALQDFMRKWPGTREQESAKLELNRMAAEEWAKASRSKNLFLLRQFIKDYPGAPEVKIAEARLLEGEVLAGWEQVKDSEDLARLESFARQHEGHEFAKHARQRIESLASDYEWVKRQDKLAIYHNYLKHNPGSPHKTAVEKRIIDLEVAEILAGEHGKLPPASPVRVTGGNLSHVEIENGTHSTLTVRYSGSQSYRFVLEPGKTHEFQVASGSYRVAASVSAPSVIPYAGTDSLQGGKYSVKFFIQTSYR